MTIEMLIAGTNEGLAVFHGGREVGLICAPDPESTTVWVWYYDDPDRDAFVDVADLSA